MNHDEKNPGAYGVWELGEFSGKLSLQLPLELKEEAWMEIPLFGTGGLLRAGEELRFLRYRITTIEKKAA